MDLNSSLDDIIGSRTKHGSRRRPHTGNPSHIHRSSSSSSRPISRGRTTQHDSQHYDTSSHRPDLRSRISNSRTADRPRGIEKTDLRGRIGKRGNSNGSSGLTTANLPNRQRYQQQQQQRASFYDNYNNDSDMERQDSHGLIITKSVNQHGLPPSSITSSSALARASRPGVGKGRGGSAEVDPATIVITKKIENTRDMTASPPNENRSSTRQEQRQQQQQQEEQDKQQQQLLKQLQDAERLKQYLQQQQQQQQEQQLRQEMDRHLQQQLQSQRELILDLQRQLDQRIAQQSLVQQQQQQTMHLGGSGSSFSFRPVVNNNNNNNNQYNDGIPPYNQSAPNIVLLSNLDSNATANDVKAACGAFGPVTRCELIKDTRGRSAGEAEVEYLDRQSALDCIAKFDNEYIDGRLIRATLRQPPTQQMRSVIAPTRSGYRTTSQVLYTSKRS